MAKEIADGKLNVTEKITLDDIAEEKLPPGKIDNPESYVEAVAVAEKIDADGKYSSEISKPTETAYWLLIAEDGTVADVGETQPNQVTTSGFGKLLTFATANERDTFLESLVTTQNKN